MHFTVNNNFLMKFFILTQQGSADEARIGPELCGHGKALNPAPRARAPPRAPGPVSC
jgi:hypothetical protein